jgi:hypothetical protein
MDIWHYCGSTEDYPEATRCFCCSLNVTHSREEHDKILADGWKSRPHVEKAPKEQRRPQMTEDAIRRRTESFKRRREFRELIWKDAQS